MLEKVYDLLQQMHETQKNLSAILPAVSSPGPNTSKLFCKYCKKPGHLMPDCRKWKAINERQNNYQQNNQNREVFSPNSQTTNSEDTSLKRPVSNNGSQGNSL